ncbi:MAG: TatD family hydrolase [Candidatus Liptonbacteria bacterium]
MKYFDAHTHAHFAAFKDDYRDVIARALREEVGLVTVGTQKDTSRRAIEVAHEFENEPVYATVGLHPIHTEASFHDAGELGDTPEAKGFTSRGEEFDFEAYRNMALDPKVVAIGECGLDYYRLGPESKTKQAEVFVGQVELARAVNKPLMVHCRRAFPDLIALIKEHKDKLRDEPGIIHFFTGTLDEAKILLDLNFSFTFGGAITFPPRKGQSEGAYNETIGFLPTNYILSETDAPYVAPIPYRGKRNEPSYVIEVVKKLAELKNVKTDEMAMQISLNANRVLGI